MAKSKPKKQTKKKPKRTEQELIERLPGVRLTVQKPPKVIRV